MTEREAVAVAREIVQAVADLAGEMLDEEDLLEVLPVELENIVLRVLKEFGRIGGSAPSRKVKG